MDEQELPRQGYLQVDVRGKQFGLWQQFRPKLIRSIEKVLDTVVDTERGTTLGEQAKQLTSAILDHCRARLERAGLDNEKIEAEIIKLHAESENIRAEARRKHAEAQAMEFRNAVQQLRLALGMSKAMLIGEEGQEAVVFGREVESFLDALKQVAESP